MSGLGSGCTSPDERIDRFARAFGRAAYVEADLEIDRLIAKEAGVDRELVASTRGLDPTIRVSRGDTHLFLLEKSLAQLALGDLEASIDLLRRCRDEMEERFSLTASDFFGSLKDDTARPFRAADYEYLMVPVLLTLVEFVRGGEDVYAYAYQIGERQDRILGDSFGTDLGDGQGAQYDPRKRYRRLPIGAYLEGIILESRLELQDAERAFVKAQQWSGPNTLIDEALERTRSGGFAEEGYGIVHVFYLAGRGPRLRQSTSPVTSDALFLAGLGAAIAGAPASVMTQAPVPVPQVQVRDIQPSRLVLSGLDGSTQMTSPLVNVNAVAQEQLDANMPWIIARAVVRRALKATAAAAVEKSVSRKNDGWVGFLAGMFTNLILTGIENADTRNWTSLPAQVHAGRFQVPAGEPFLDFGGGCAARVRVDRGSESYVLVLRPDLTRPGVVLVDPASRVETEPAPPAE